MFLQLLNADLDFQTKALIFVTFLIAMVVALTFHEAAHAFAAHKSGDFTPKLAGRLTLNPFAHIDPFGFFSFLFLGFGWAKPVPVNSFNFKNYKRNTFFVSIAGVLSNLIIAFIFMPLMGLIILFAANIKSLFWLQVLMYLFSFMIEINILLIVFNMLPIYPLDGFNAVAAYLKYENRFVQFMRRWGHLVLIGLLIVFEIVYSSTGVDILGELCYYISYPFTALWSWIMGLPTNTIGLFVLGV